MFKVGDYVTRKKYGNDIIFKIIDIEDEIIHLIGVDVRLCADAHKDDLFMAPIPKKKDEIDNIRSINKNDYFYIISNVLQLDSDKSYLEKCLDLYKKNDIKCIGILEKESNYENIIIDYLNKYKPAIVVITGHDAYYKNKKNNKHYKNSDYFINTVKKIKSYDKRIIVIAGACQSDYVNLIKSGSTFASSPNHINIHALDPAIIASYIALTDRNEIIDIEKILNKTHYGKKGFGGLIIKGTMLKGFPRKEI